MRAQLSAMFVVASMSAVVAGCSGASAALPSEGAADPTAPIDDAQLVQQLLQGARLLHEGGRTVPMKVLIAQLARASARGALPTPGQSALRPAQLHAMARRSVLVIGSLYKCGKCVDWHVGQSSGFVITSDGLAVTSYHVVNRAENTTLVAMTAEGLVFAVKEVVAASAANDVAVLRLDADNLEPLPLAATVAPGEPVLVMSHPDGALFSLSAGIVSRQFWRQRGGQRAPVLQITADFAKGSSGAPVINARGAVVGVASYTRSIHYDANGVNKRNLQMVQKNCSLASRIRALFVQ